MPIHFGEASSVFKQKCPHIKQFLYKTQAKICLWVGSKQYGKAKQRCRDGVMSDFVGILFHEVTALHPPSFHRNDFSSCHNILLLL